MITSNSTPIQRAKAQILPNRYELPNLIETLAGHHDETCITIVFPTHLRRSGKELAGHPSIDSLRGELSRLLGQHANESGQNAAVSAATEREHQQLLKKAEDFVRKTAKEWLRFKKGAAIYVSKNLAEIIKLNFDPHPIVVVADRFHIKPLLRLQQTSEPFWLLRTTTKRFEFFRVDPFRITQVDAFTLDEKTNGLHGKDALREAAERILPNYRKERLPLLLSGDPKVCRAFEKRNAGLFEIVPTTSDGQIDHSPQEGLYWLAQQMMKSLGENSAEKMLQFYRSSEKQHLTTTNLLQISRLAASGRIDSLFIAEDRNVWGVYDHVQGVRSINNEQQGTEDLDLLDAIAQETLQHGGTVTLLPAEKMPNRSSIAAILAPFKEAARKRIANVSMQPWFMMGQAEANGETGIVEIPAAVTVVGQQRATA